MDAVIDRLLNITEIVLGLSLTDDEKDKLGDAYYHYLQHSEGKLIKNDETKTNFKERNS